MSASDTTMQFNFSTYDHLPWGVQHVAMCVALLAFGLTAAGLAAMALIFAPVEGVYKLATLVGRCFDELIQGFSDWRAQRKWRKDMWLLALLLAVAVSTPACMMTDEQGASHALRVNGYKDVTLTGYAWGECSDSDGSCTGFSATAPNGEHVEGAVGCGLSLFGPRKGCTIRLR